MDNKIDEQKLVSQISAKIAQESKAATLKSNIYGIVLFVAGLLWIFFSYTIIEKKEQEADKHLKDLGDSTRIITEHLLRLKDSVTLYQSKYIMTKGDFSDKKGIEEGVKADNYLESIADTNKIDQQIIIQYYRKSLDDQKIWLAIRELGYTNLQEKDSKLEGKTNCVYYGSSVSLYDLKLILATLLRAGSQIDFINPYQVQNGKEKTIQIIAKVHRPGQEGGTPLKLEEVMHAKDFDSLIRGKN